MAAADDKPTEYRQYRFSLPPGATDILLVRHGESRPARAGQVEPVVDGHADPPLDPRGQEEARRVAERLQHEDVAAIYVTTLQRTAQTAAPLAATLGLEPVVEPALREVFLGAWEGGTFRMRVSEGDPLAEKLFTTERWDVIPGAESNEAFAARLRDGVERIAAAHPDQRVVVFTHGGAIGMLVALASGARPFAFLGADNGSITHLVVMPSGPEPEAWPQRWIIRRFNDTGHLGTDLDKPVEPLT